MTNDDPYAVLGVGRDASEDAAHRAYLALAKRYHPDVNRDDPDADQRFSEIVAAHEAIRADHARRRDNVDMLRRRRADAAAAVSHRQGRRARSTVAPGSAASPRLRTRRTDGLVITLLWFAAVMILLAIM